MESIEGQLKDKVLILLGQLQHLVDKHRAGNASAPHQAAVGQGAVIPNHQHLNLHVRTDIAPFGEDKSNAMCVCRS